MTLPSGKEAHELRDAFDVLQIWQEHFKHRFGDLQAITHHGNPDDPPDAVAQFRQGIIDIEHTIIEPAHVMQSNALHYSLGGGARNGMPISYKPADKHEMKEIMMNLNHPKSWENVFDALDTRLKLIVIAVAKKVGKYPPGGLLILQGSILGNLFEKSMIKEAFKYVSALTGAEKWTIAVIYRWNNSGFFSALVRPKSDQVSFQYKAP